MALVHNPRISTNGLIVYLDAANPRSYPGSGTTWNDLSANGNNGTLTNGPTFATENGGNITFDGSNDSVDFTSRNLGNEITIMCFVRPQSTAQIQTLFSNGGDGTATGARFFLNTWNTNSRHIVAEVGNGSSADASLILTRVVYNQWQHVACVFNKNTSKLKLFYNGIQETDYTTSVNNYNTNGAFRLGGFFATAFYPLNGKIGNYLIYNRELTPNEVLQNFQATRTRFGI